MTIAEVSKKYGMTQDTLRYYEKVGMIPPVPRTRSGLRDFDEESCRWVELAKCMRSAGLPVEVLVEYTRLFREGDTTIGERRELLMNQLRQLEEQKAAIEETMERLKFKISRYEEALVTGVLDWKLEDVSKKRA